jgi:protease-4
LLRRLLARVAGQRDRHPALFEEEFKTTVHLIRSGRHKGIGTPGVPIEDDNLEALQSEVDTSHAVFVADIARGLEVPEERVEEIADGRTFVGANAVREGLADRLGSFDETLSALIDTHGTPIAAAV